MAYKTGDVSRTFDGDYVIHGLHCTIDEANELLLKSDYPEITATKVEHCYATWGKLSFDLSDGTGYGWWFVDPSKGYKHIKKMTIIY